MFILKPKNLFTDFKYISKATFDAAYGLEGKILESSSDGFFTDPYISEVPIWIKFFKYFLFMRLSTNFDNPTEFVSKNLQEFFQETAPSPCAA